MIFLVLGLQSSLVGRHAEFIVLIEDRVHLLRLLKGLPAIERIVVPADFDEAIGHEAMSFASIAGTTANLTPAAIAISLYSAGTTISRNSGKSLIDRKAFELTSTASYPPRPAPSITVPNTSESIRIPGKGSMSDLFM